MGYKLNVAPVRSVYPQHSRPIWRPRTRGDGPVILALQNKLAETQGVARLPRPAVLRQESVASVARQARGHWGYCPSLCSDSFSFISIFGGTPASLFGRPGSRMPARTIGSLDTSANAKQEGLP